MHVHVHVHIHIKVVYSVYCELMYTQLSVDSHSTAGFPTGY